MQRKSKAESHSISEETKYMESQVVSGNTLQKVTSAQKIQTPWNHSYSAETHCRKSQLLRGNKLHGITATKQKQTTECHSY